MEKGYSGLRLAFYFLAFFTPLALAMSETELNQTLDKANVNIASIQAEGPSVLPLLAKLYTSSESTSKRARIAWVFYQLGWISNEAEMALMQDINTNDSELRLQVQWALGRVSNNDKVVDVLLDKMQNDSNALFRDKAACALANDQIHLSPIQEFHLVEGLIKALRDPKPQVRDIAIKALQIHTGQTFGFNPNAPIMDRERIVTGWEKWLEEYRANL